MAYAHPGAACDSLSSPSSSMGIAIPTLQELIDGALMWIKRTWQPSLVKRKRKHGFMKRKESVGGRKVLKRRFNKGRKRLSC